jgi:hypothetical protein
MPADATIQPTNERPNYFAGQYLLEDDFQLEQQYHIDRQRWHHHLLHVSGIAEGLQVEKIENTLSVRVLPGSAIDPQGRQIISIDVRSVNLTELFSNKKEEIPNGDYILWIQYSDKKTNQQTTGDEITSRRWQEEPKFQFTGVGASELTDCIVLAKLTIKNNTISGDIDNRDRIYSGLRLPSYGGGITLQAQKGTTPSLAELKGSLSILGTLATTGNVGIGKTSPSEKLDVVGNIKATGSIAGNSLSVAGDIAAANATLTGNVTAIGAITPSSGNDTTKGILFPLNPGGGTGDAAWIRYYSRNPSSTSAVDKEQLTLEIGIANDVSDHIALIPSGNVGIGTTSPGEKLDVSGNIKSTNITATGSITGNTLSVGVPLVSGSGTSQTRTSSSANIDLSGHVQLKEYADSNVAFLQARDDRLNRDIGLQIRTQKQDSSGTRTVVEALRIAPSGNVGIGTTSPSRKLEILEDVAGLSFEVGAGSPHSGAIRFGDNTGWKLHFGRSRESVDGAKNAGTQGLLMTVQDNGNIGIGTATPLQTLDVHGRIHVNNGVIQRGGTTAITNTSDLGLYSQVDANWMRLVTKNGPIRFFSDGGAGTTWNMSIETSGNIFARGTFNPSNSASDIRLKNNIMPLTNMLEKLEKIRGISFEWNESSKSLGFSVGEREIGVIAQEVETEFPELVYNLKAHEYKAVSYDKMAGVLIEAIKELKAKHDELVRVHHGEIEALKADIKSMKLL